DDIPLSVLEALVEAALAAGVARDAAHLLDDQQDAVAVAVEADLAHSLHVPRTLALAPELVARARPVMRAIGLHRPRQRLAIHPGERQHAVRRGVLRNRGHEAVDVPADALEPVGVAGDAFQPFDHRTRHSTRRISIPAA